MKYSRTGRVLATLLALAFLTAVALAPLNASAHGATGRRTLVMFDINGMSAPQTAMAVSDAYQTQVLALNPDQDNGCLSIAVAPARFSWDSAPQYMTQGASRTDYAITGVFSGVAQGGGGTVSLELVTANRRKSVATVSSSPCPTAQAAASDAARKMMGTALLERVYAFEKRTRDEDVETALGPRMSMPGWPTRMKLGQTTKLTIRLEDCDGYKLKGRKIEVSSDVGEISPSEVTVGEDGTAECTYTAPNKRTEASIGVRFTYYLGSYRPETLMLSSPISVRDDKPVDPTVFHVILEVNKRLESNIKLSTGNTLFDQTQRLVMSVDLLRLEFDVNQRMEPIRSTMKASYRWNRAYSHLSTPMQEKESSDAVTRTDLADWSVSLVRYVDPVDDDTVLRAYDSPMFERLSAVFNKLPVPQPKDTMRVDLSALLHTPTASDRVTLGSTDRSTDDTLEHVLTTAELPYEYTKSVNEGSKELAKPDAGGVAVMANSLKYRLELKKAKFEYMPATGPSVTIDDEDYTDKFGYDMYWREWTVPFRNNVPGSPKKGEYGITQPWVKGDDGVRGGYAGVMKLLSDEGLRGSEDSTSLRRLREYLVAVDKFPEYGYWYCVMTIDTSSTGSVVQIFKPINVKADEWKKIKAARQPFRDEISSGEPVRYYRTGY